MDAQHYRRLLEENLRLHRPQLLVELRAQGELESYLRETAEEAASRFFLLVSQLLKANPPPKDYLARVSHLALGRLMDGPRAPSFQATTFRHASR